MDYEQACRYLESLAQRGWRMGLDRMQELCSRAGLESVLGGPAGPKFLHVAGTNGKGSVTAFLQSMLTEGGHRTGSYYSPYVVDIRERVQVDGAMISRADFARHVSSLAPIGESLAETPFGGATEFEIKTAMGFRHWAEARCDWVALEVGLGGRLDATNVVTPAASCVVSIGLDHKHLLGNTHAAIAAEKAGVVKPGVPIVIGKMCDEALEVIEREASAKGAPVWRVGHEVVTARVPSGELLVSTPVGQVGGLTSGLLGSQAPHNLAVAIGMLHAAEINLSDEVLRAGAARTRLPGRYETRHWRGRPILLDGAHNTEAAEALAATLAERAPGRRVHLVLAMTQGHDARGFIDPLASLVDAIHLAPIDFHRAQSVEALRQSLLPRDSQPHPTVEAALAAACDEAPEEALVLVTGSFYLVGDVSRLTS